MDVDIDFKTNFNPLEYFKEAVRASQVNKGNIQPHTAGIYFQSIPKDKISGTAAIPYQEAEKLGYFKFDMLHLSLLDDFESKEEIRQLLKIEPDWSLLEKQEVVEKLFQIHRQFDVVNIIKPKSIEDLCDCVAIYRPGKKHLIKYYNENREFVRNELWKRPDDPEKYYFKRSHALAYAMNIVLQLHLISVGAL
jgi:DNA polymerase III alpha subunit